jgi:SAM-dependent methyltransferase
MFAVLIKALGKSQRLPQVIYGKVRRVARKTGARLLVSVRRRNLRSTFVNIYKQNSWGGTISVSGTGSDLQQTAVVRQLLPELVQQLNVRSILDAPCGDFYWLNKCSLGVAKYYGIDIVPDIIATNRKQYGREGMVFICGDLTRNSLPQVDLILCRDCLVHLSFKKAKIIIANFVRSKSRYLLTTTFPGTTSNKDIISGEWRPLDLQLAPFNFPEPLMLIAENCSELNGRYSNKSLGLWSLEQINSIPRLQVDT